MSERRWVRWVGRLAIALVGLVVLLVVAGLVYQAAASAGDRKRYPPLGTLVDIGERALHLHCVGEGSPTVVFEAGAGGGVLDWTLVQDEVGEFTRACAYDRAGIGWSDAASRPLSKAEVSTNLHDLLDNGDVDGPLVLVGHSLGGFYVRSFAESWPDRVAGMVLVESSHENQARRMPPEVMEAQLGMMRVLTMCRMLAPFGLMRLAKFADGFTEGLPFTEERREAVIAVMNRTGYCAGLANELEAAMADSAETDPPTPLGDLPLIVLSAGIQDTLPPAEFSGSGVTPDIMRATNAVWNQMQAELAGLSTRGVHEIATESEHYIQFDQPDLVVDAVRRVVMQARDEASSPPNSNPTLH
ncbi:MAG: alpha/beta hydrolase [Gemmatimonadota bacterium]|nr:MAG: alpha/beta hydrolase [Gemmatimonadota bacterium]